MMTSAMPLLDVQGISKSFGGLQAVKNLRFVVEPGEILGLIGPNGAGKTTLLKTISGLLKLSSGVISFEGHRIDHLRPNPIVRMGISQCPEGRKLFPEMTVLKNLRLGAFLRRQDKEPGNNR
jgi:branched-chain amino acid transport system ATP-binding protein